MLRSWGLLPCTQGKMNNKSMRLHTHVNTRPEAVVHTDVSEINVLSLGEAGYFFTSTNEVSSRGKVFHMKTTSEATQLFKLHVRWVERQNEASVKNIVPDGGKEHLEMSQPMEGYESEMFTTTTYKLQEKGRAERVSCTIKNAIGIC